MSVLKLTLASAFSLLAVSASCASLPSGKDDSKAEFAKWAAIKTIFPGPVQPLGSYDAGCLAGATVLNTDAPGYAIMRLSRNRYYSHPDMNTYLHDLGDKLQAMKMPLLLIGDVSPPRGGPMLTGHASHQIGLDADIWLTMGKSRPTTAQRESWGAPSFVIGRKVLKKTWGKTQASLVATAASFDSVNRIFVSPAIKKYFCLTQPKAEWLYKLRSWWGHEEHVHVRLNCPAGSTTCIAQPPLNSLDNGCGTDLDWWFSKEADDEWTKIVNNPTPREFPALPAECGKMVEP